MSRPGFRQRAAHLSYVAPLVSYLIWLQLARDDPARDAAIQPMLIPVLAALAGLWLAFSALGFQEGSEAPKSPGVAWLGGALNLALLLRMGWAFFG